jgi:hypothetical protein
VYTARPVRTDQTSHHLSDVNESGFDPYTHVPQVSAGLPAPYQKGGTCCQALLLHLGGSILARRESHDTMRCHTAERALSHISQVLCMKLSLTKSLIYGAMVLCIVATSASYTVNTVYR